jgi:hypothetical protein
MASVPMARHEIVEQFFCFFIVGATIVNGTYYLTGKVSLSVASFQRGVWEKCAARSGKKTSRCVCTSSNVM